MQQLVPCKLCGRRFFPDRIEVHQNSCKGSQGHPINNGSNKSSSSFCNKAKQAVTHKNLKNIMAASCGATFGLCNDNSILIDLGNGLAPGCSEPSMVASSTSKLLFMTSPQPVRRQLHDPQDVVVVIKSQDKILAKAWSSGTPPC